MTDTMALDELVLALHDISAALLQHKAQHSAAVVSQAATLLVSQRVDIGDKQRRIEALERESMHEPPPPTPPKAIEPLPEEGEAERCAPDSDEPLVPPVPPRWFALRLPDGRYLEKLRFAEWDTPLNRVSGDGLPGVWTEAHAAVIAELLNRLGAHIEVVDTADVAPTGLRSA